MSVAAIVCGTIGGVSILITLLSCIMYRRRRKVFESSPNEYKSYSNDQGFRREQASGFQNNVSKVQVNKVNAVPANGPSGPMNEFGPYVQMADEDEFDAEEFYRKNWETSTEPIPMQAASTVAYMPSFAMPSNNPYQPDPHFLSYPQMEASQVPVPSFYPSPSQMTYPQMEVQQDPVPYFYPSTSPTTYPQMEVQNAPVPSFYPSISQTVVEEGKKKKKEKEVKFVVDTLRIKKKKKKPKNSDTSSSIEDSDVEMKKKSKKGKKIKKVKQASSDTTSSSDDSDEEVNKKSKKEKKKKNAKKRITPKDAVFQTDQQTQQQVSQQPLQQYAPVQQLQQPQILQFNLPQQNKQQAQVLQLNTQAEQQPQLQQQLLQHAQQLQQQQQATAYLISAPFTEKKITTTTYELEPVIDQYQVQGPTVFTPRQPNQPPKPYEMQEKSMKIADDYDYCSGAFVGATINVTGGSCEGGSVYTSSRGADGIGGVSSGGGCGGGISNSGRAAVYGWGARRFISGNAGGFGGAKGVVINTKPSSTAFSAFSQQRNASPKGVEEKGYSVDF